MTDQKLSEKESLELISRVIIETRRQFSRENSRIFMLWGYLTISVSILVYALLSTTGSTWMHLFWFLIPVIGYPAQFMVLRKGNNKTTTLIDRAIANIWIVIGFCCIIVPVVTLTAKISIPILITEAILINIALALSGLTLKLKVVTVLGFLGVALSFGLSYLTVLEQVLAFGVYLGLSMAITGHIMQLSKSKKEVTAYV